MNLVAKARPLACLLLTIMHIGGLQVLPWSGADTDELVGGRQGVLAHPGPEPPCNVG
jgi:hypothetical protein